jgi:hypothetical protein
MTVWMIANTLLLILGTARLVRLITADALTQPLRDRLEAWAYTPADEAAQRRRLFWLEFAECPFCIGFWLGAIFLIVFVLVGGPATTPFWWDLIMSALALNMIIGPLVSATSPGDQPPDRSYDAN